MLCIFSHNFFDSILSLYQLSLFLLWKPFNISDRTTLSFNVKVFLLKSSRVYPMLLKMFVFKIPSRIVNQWLSCNILCVYISWVYKSFRTLSETTDNIKLIVVFLKLSSIIDNTHVLQFEKDESFQKCRNLNVLFEFFNMFDELSQICAIILLAK